MTTIKDELKNKTGVSKIAAKANAIETENKIIESSKAVLSDEELIKKQLSELNVREYADKTEQNSNIWKAQFLDSLSNSDKSARRKARDNFQIPLSISVCKKDKNKSLYKPEKSLKDICEKLRDFYNIALMDFNHYTQIRETSKNYDTIHNAHKIMKRELNLS